ncbi:YggT family protein [Ligilactobacillus equi]|uniref:YggT family protein n=1 Tax=Ligilactobacillus equi TaxID=137357 RepID=UPI000429713F|nr:YggT family protein [Ligilactobacillus equi]MCQ2556383.1 YggT family protein [Ligilactobacillus sp.]
MILLLVAYFFRFYELAIVAYVLLSWFPGAYQTTFGRILTKLCEPYLSIFRFIPPILGLDFSPWVALIALQFVQMGAVGLLTGFGL